MSRLVLTVLGAKPAPHTAAPAIVFRLRIEDLDGGRLHAMVLRCETRIEPRGRRYTKEEQARLYELFGDASQWDRTLRAVSWCQASLVVPSFERRIDVDLTVTCTYDLDIASAKFLHAIRDGDVPLGFLFSGTIFTSLPANEAGSARTFSVEPVPWDLEASFRMPATVWRAAMDQFFPGGGWVRLESATIDRLQAFRGRQAIVSWDAVMNQLLDHAPSEQPA